MAWTKNNRHKIITYLLFSFFLALLLFASQSNLTSYDSFWHLKTGDDLLNKGLSPFIDHYSFTFFNMEIASPTIIFEIILSFFVSLFGFSEGYYLIRAFSACLFLFVTFKFFKEIKAPWPIIAITLPYITLFLLFRFHHVRPEVIDNVLIMLTLLLYIKAKNTFNNRNLTYIALLLLFWVNYHTAILGYIIIFGLFLDKAINLILKKDDHLNWQHWLFWGAVIFIIGFINTDYNHPIISTLSFSKEWALTSEFRPTHELIPNSSFFNFFWLVSGYLCITLLLQKQWGFAFITCLFAIKSWEVIRVLPIAGIIISSLMAISLTKIDFQELFKKLKKYIQVIVIALGIIVSLTGIALVIIDSKNKKVQPNKADLPYAITPYLKNSHPEGGNIFNQLRHGGFLLYHLPENFKVYIDGRSNILYPLNFVKHFSKIYNSKSPELLSQEIDRYNIKFAILPLTPDVFTMAHNSKKMFVEFVGEHFILFSSQDNNFPISTSNLLFPMCWKQSHQQAVSNEYKIGNEILSENSALRPILETLHTLQKIDDYALYWEKLDVENITSEYQKRLLAYVALKSGYNEQAIKLFNSIKRKETLDILMMSHSHLKNKNFEKAENLLTFITSKPWSLLQKKDLSIDNKAIAIKLFEKIKKEHSLSDGNNAKYTIFKRSFYQENPNIKLPVSIPPQKDCPKFTSALPSYLQRY